MTEVDYPYEARIQPYHRARIEKHAKHPLFEHRIVKTLFKNDEENLKKVLALVGPVAVNIHVDNKIMLYGSEVFRADFDCLNKEINHAVLVAGYGEDTEGGSYWILKNSWGSQWETGAT